MLSRAHWRRAGLWIIGVLLIALLVGGFLAYFVLSTGTDPPATVSTSEEDLFIFINEDSSGPVVLMNEDSEVRLVVGPTDASNAYTVDKNGSDYSDGPNHSWDVSNESMELFVALSQREVAKGEHLNSHDIYWQSALVNIEF